MPRGLAMAKNIWDISENSLVNVIMVTTREGQSWTIRDARVVE